MQVNDKLPVMGDWGKIVTHDADGQWTVGEATLASSIAAVQTNELIFAMGQQIVKLTRLAEAQQKALEGILAALQKSG